MLRLLARRLLQAIPTVLVLSVVLFLCLAVLPGDAALATLGEYSNETQRQIFREKLGLTLPIHEQYFRWLANLLRGDFGLSMRSREPVIEMIIGRVPVTIELAFLSVSLATALGVPLGIVAAMKRDGRFDAIVRIGSIAGLSVPYFWIGILLIIAFSVNLGWVPPSGYVSPTVDLARNLQLMLLPTITVALPAIGLITRQTRAAMLEVMQEDYVRTARSKGLPESVVILHHVLRNALIPIITVVSLQLGHLVSGTVVVETIFSLPGIGKMIIEAIYERDIYALQGAIVVVILLVIVVNLITDVAYGFVDKRASA